jgi:hypothetical protein
MIEIGGTPGKGSFTKLAARTILNNLSIATGLFDTVDVRLYTGGPSPNPGMLWGAFTEATFGGYAPVAGITFETSTWEDDKAKMIAIAVPALFAATGVAPANDVKGWAITKTVAGVTTVIYAEEFDAIKQMEFVADQIYVVPEIELVGTV